MYTIKFENGLKLLTKNEVDADRLVEMTNYWSKSQQQKFLQMCKEFTVAVYARTNKRMPENELFAPKECIDWLAKQPIKTGVVGSSSTGLSNHQRMTIINQQNTINRININNHQMMMQQFRH